MSVSGTSAASPTVGSLVALLNDAIFNDGGSALGFLNPLLYKLGPGALNDITQGSNPGCGTDVFTATEGWDPVCAAHTLGGLVRDCTDRRFPDYWSWDP